MDFNQWTEKHQLDTETISTLKQEDLNDIEMLKEITVDGINDLELKPEQKALLSTAIQSLGIQNDDSELGIWASQHRIDPDTMHALKTVGFDSPEKLKKANPITIKSLKIKAGQKLRLNKGIDELKDTEFIRNLKGRGVKEETIEKLREEEYDSKEMFVLMQKESVERLNLPESQQLLLLKILREFEGGEKEVQRSISYDNEFSKYLIEKELKEETVKILIDNEYESKDTLKLMKQEHVDKLLVTDAQKLLLCNIVKELNGQEKFEKKTQPISYGEAYEQFLKVIGLNQITITNLKDFGMDSPRALVILNKDLDTLNLSEDQRNIVNDAIKQLKEFHQDVKSTIVKVLQPRRNSEPTDGVIGAYLEFLTMTKDCAKPASANIASYMDAVGAKGKPEGQILDNGMRVLKLPVIQVHEDEEGKIRKCIIGKETTSSRKQQKTIMVVGATGAGKSTLIDGLCNYLFDSKWEEKNRFKLIDEHNEELANLEVGQAMSQTEWITIYNIYSSNSSRFKFNLNLIDTPGFGDTRGIARDEKLVEQIRSLFKNKADHGVDSIDAVCFVAKAPDARLTPTQRYVFGAIMSVFGKDIEENIVVMITFGDGAKAPVLEAIKTAKLPYRAEFKFNNSALFANNGVSEDQTYVSVEEAHNAAFGRMFWDMGMQSFDNFFEFLDGLVPKSLYLTNEVLEQRRILKDTLTYLEDRIRISLTKMDEFKEEERILKENENRMEDNKDFRYSVTRNHFIRVPCRRGQYVTHCMICQETCHEKCTLITDEIKYQCDAMDPKTGKCRKCKLKCRWSSHKHTGYFLQQKIKTEEHVWDIKLKEYQKACETAVTKKDIIAKLKAEYAQCEEDIRDYVNRCRDALKTLRRIAMKPDSLTEIQYIDELIMIEKDDLKQGWRQRVDHLEKFKKEAERLHDIWNETDFNTDK